MLKLQKRLFLELFARDNKKDLRDHVSEMKRFRKSKSRGC